MYLCEVTEQWVVCDLMNNSRTVYAKSVDFGKACAADVLEWMVHEGEGEAGWRRRQGFVMSRTKWSETEEKAEGGADRRGDDGTESGHRGKH